jgi:hypothetical protein
MIKNPNPVSTAAPASTTADLDVSQVQQPPVEEPLKATCPESVYKIEGRYCDYVTLENGTRIKNPNNISLIVVEVQKQPQSVQEQQQMTHKILPPGGKCLGFQSSPTYCKNIQMPDGSMILNKHWTPNVFTVDPNVLYANDPYVGSTEPGPSKEDTQTQAQTFYEDETPDTDQAVEEEASDGKEEESVNPYCDKLSDEDSLTQSCWDRRDHSGDTGLYPCHDGSYKKDYKDCKDLSGYDYDNDNGDEEEESGSGCQEQDDYCDKSEDCDSPVVDCIDDVNIGDDGDNGNSEDEEEESSDEGSDEGESEDSEEGSYEEAAE